MLTALGDVAPADDVAARRSPSARDLKIAQCFRAARSLCAPGNPALDARREGR
jgi:hypothetical protein